MVQSRFELIGVTHFTPDEFKCKCHGRHCDGFGDMPEVDYIAELPCPAYSIDSALLLGLEELRYRAGRIPLRIVSGIRCSKYNAELGNVPTSQHVIGRAADILTRSPERQATLIRVAKTIPVFNRGGIGRYDRFMHVDVRGEHGRRRARWDCRTKR